MNTILDRWTSYRLRKGPFIDINFFGSRINIMDNGEIKLKNCEKKAYKNFKKLLNLLEIKEDSEIVVYIVIKEDYSSMGGFIIDYDYNFFLDNIDLIGEETINGMTFIKGTISLDSIYFIMKKYFHENSDEFDKLRLLFYFQAKDMYLQVMDELFGILVKDSKNNKGHIPLRNIYYKLQEIDDEILNIHWREEMKRCLYM